jgi:SpoIIAA-like
VVRPAIIERMIELIDGLPDDTVGIRLVGKIEADDYKRILIPALETARDAHAKVNILCVIDSGFGGYSGGAAWDDAKYGFGNLTGWGRMALVSDRDWVHHVSGIGKLFLGGRLRTFPEAELDHAKAWVSSGNGADN